MWQDSILKPSSSAPELLGRVERQDIAFFDTEARTAEVIGRMSADTTLIQDSIGEKDVDGACCRLLRLHEGDKEAKFLIPINEVNHLLSCSAVSARLSTDSSTVKSLAGDTLTLIVQNLSTVMVKREGATQMANDAINNGRVQEEMSRARKTSGSVLGLLNQKPYAPSLYDVSFDLVLTTKFEQESTFPILLPSPQTPIKPKIMQLQYLTFLILHLPLTPAAMKTIDHKLVEVAKNGLVGQEPIVFNESIRASVAYDKERIALPCCRENVQAAKASNARTPIVLDVAESKNAVQEI
ncbi:hypothetical protein V8G54_033814 [Vigna mungo]|uniref:Uncharacterized protein n=1 Tax=Vigna mungo TaxID=3915 RepID=A0AAQ3MNZ2_VIGMU